MKFLKVQVRSGHKYGFVVRSEDNQPKIGEKLCSVASSLDHTSPGFMLFDNFKIDEILSVEDYK